MRAQIRSNDSGAQRRRSWPRKRNPFAATTPAEGALGPSAHTPLGILFWAVSIAAGLGIAFPDLCERILEGAALKA